ncbi:hypothetical protein J8F10_09095 [Gemmata sp. G18]|uniref:Prepilin peptidase n=1 Tax=Gemmata palustris TaxID=2822762 RepID=A0ABS5BP59_9BACT|nr:hypothetical protein [Gemmata palustris]MBP3955436.1 hypothetical protein [Gemmata palustris]
MSDFQFLILTALLCYLIAAMDRSGENKPVFFALSAVAASLALFCAGFQP